jgi:hypothetical protein
LRGRDIKRYSYEFADLYLITTFPSLKIDIEQYPAVKQHLLSFGYDRLKQTGDKGSRKKTNNKWFETQDSISYWEDFYKQKVVYPETTQGAYFAFDDKQMFIDKTCFMLISKHAIYIQKTLSSKLFEFAYKCIFSSIELGTNGYQYNKHALVKLPISSNNKAIITIENLSDDLKINQVIYNLYELTNEEIQFIENRQG